MHSAVSLMSFLAILFYVSKDDNVIYGKWDVQYVAFTYSSIGEEELEAIAKCPKTKIEMEPGKFLLHGECSVFRMFRGFHNDRFTYIYRDSAAQIYSPKTMAIIFSDPKRDRIEVCNTNYPNDEFDSGLMQVFKLDNDNLFLYMDETIVRISRSEN